MRRKIGLRRVKSEPALEGREDMVDRRKTFISAIFWSAILLTMMIFFFAFALPRLDTASILLALGIIILAEMIFFLFRSRNFIHRKWKIKMAFLHIALFLILSMAILLLYLAVGLE